MEIAHYDIDFEKIKEIIDKNGFKKILIQLPDGLKNYTNQFQKIITSMSKVDIFFSSDTCFGACDIPCLSNLNLLGIEAIFHIGHTPILALEHIKERVPFFFINVLSTYDIEKVVYKACKKLIGQNIAIATTAQYLHKLDQVESILKSEGFNPLLLEGDRRIWSKGQILGCNFSSIRNIDDNIDSILFIGSGFFHPLGLLLTLKKPVIIGDPLTQLVKRDELVDIKDKVLRQRYAAISVAKMSHKFGIIICTKPGQQQYDKAIECREILEFFKKETYLFIMDHINPLFLENYPFIDCFVSTACPRISIDDYKQYKKPIISSFELKIAFDLESFDHYQFDEIKDFC